MSCFHRWAWPSDFHDLDINSYILSVKYFIYSISKDVEEVDHPTDFSKDIQGVNPLNDVSENVQGMNT